MKRFRTCAHVVFSIIFDSIFTCLHLLSPVLIDFHQWGHLGARTRHFTKKENQYKETPIYQLVGSTNPEWGKGCPLWRSFLAKLSGFPFLLLFLAFLPGYPSGLFFMAFLFCLLFLASLRLILYGFSFCLSFLVIPATSPLCLPFLAPRSGYAFWQSLVAILSGDPF